MATISDQNGSGDDVLNGTSGDDVIISRSGADTINAGDGNDRIYLFSTPTVLDGGAGNDAAYIYADVKFNAGSVSGIERFFVGDGHTVDFSNVDQGAGLDIRSFSTAGSTSTIVGSAYGDYILGNDGNDIISGGGGNDTIWGGNGNDVLRGGDGDDNLYGGNGNDYIVGDAGHNVLLGGEGDDTILSKGGIDKIDGGIGQDFLVLDRSGSTTALTLDISNTSTVQLIGDGSSVVNIERLEVYGGSGNDKIVGGILADKLDGGAGNDTLVSGGGDDILAGREGNDTLIGGSGHSLLSGGDGDDRLVSGSGNEVLQGDAGNDTFAFNISNFGKDYLQGFVGGAAGGDVLEFSKAVFADYASVMAHTTQSGPNAVITLDANDSLTIENVKIADLTASHFHFVA